MGSLILTLFFGFGHSIQKWPSVPKRPGTSLSLSEVTSYSHLHKPTWLILYSICEKSEVFQRCFQGYSASRMPPRRCVVQDCDRVADKELGISILLVRAASVPCGKDLSANTENISSRREHLAYAPFILPTTASLVQCM